MLFRLADSWLAPSADGRGIAVVPVGRVPFGGVDMRRPGYPGGAWDGDGLLERAEPLALLDEPLTAVAGDGPGQTALVVGEAGIGKTALLRGFGGSVTGAARVLWAACDHLYPAAAGAVSWTWPRRPGGRRAARVVDAARPYDVAAALPAELGSGGTAVVVLEDVHWADAASLDVIRLLARRIERVPATVRPELPRR